MDTDQDFHWRRDRVEPAPSYRRRRLSPFRFFEAIQPDRVSKRIGPVWFDWLTLAPDDAGPYYVRIGHRGNVFEFQMENSAGGALGSVVAVTVPAYLEPRARFDVFLHVCHRLAIAAGDGNGPVSGDGLRSLLARRRMRRLKARSRPLRLGHAELVAERACLVATWFEQHAAAAELQHISTRAAVRFCEHYADAIAVNIGRSKY